MTFYAKGCARCDETDVCKRCSNCEEHCFCGEGAFDADELGLDPETDNTPGDPDRHA